MDFGSPYQHKYSYSRVPESRSACHELLPGHSKDVTYVMHGEELSDGEYDAGIPWKNGKRCEDEI